MENLHKVLKDTMGIITLAGRKVLLYYGQEIDIKDKGNDSPVTIADIESNKILITGLSKYNCPILSEEGAFDEDRLDSELLWIIDPMDGTKDFIQKTGEFTIMVGLVAKQRSGDYRPLLGIIYRPVTDTFYYALKGEGAWSRENGGPIKKLFVSPEKAWHNVVMLTSRNHTTDIEWKMVSSLGIAKVETYGSSLKACLVAEGAAQLNFNPAPYTWEWDICPSDLIIHEAGGKFTDSRGKIFSYNKKNPKNLHGYVASNGLIHHDIICEIKRLKG